MPELRAKGTSIALTLLRVVVGLIMVVHGSGKLGDVQGTAAGFEQMGVLLPEISVWLAIAGEFVGGLLLLMGAATPLAALGIFCVMAVAISAVHLTHGLLAQNNGFEYPLTIACVSLYFIMRGGGPYSVDALLRKQRGYEKDPVARRIGQAANA